MPCLPWEKRDCSIMWQGKSGERPLKGFRSVDFPPGPVGGGTVPCDQITIRGKMKRVETFQVRRRPLVSLNR